MTLDFCCMKLQLDSERYRRWVKVHRQTGRYGGGKHGPRKGLHTLLAEEKAKMMALGREEVYGDLSHRQLAEVGGSQEWAA